jgi:hypothetical protein
LQGELDQKSAGHEVWGKVGRTERSSSANCINASKGILPSITYPNKLSWHDGAKDTRSLVNYSSIGSRWVTVSIPTCAGYTTRSAADRKEMDQKLGVCLDHCRVVRGIAIYSRWLGNV